VRKTAEETKGGAPTSGRREGFPAVKDLSTLFKALSDETRLRILKLLEGGELCVCHVVAAFDMSQSKVSFHLGVLKAAGLLKDRKEGKWMHYKIDDSDLFRRLLLLSVIEKIPEETLREDRKRLGDFIDSWVGTVPPSGWCCSKRDGRGS
jgi:ArsR family transcriptional regulator, arsenate/arsenite/antimonite-responsive transcriptional repressor